MTLQKNQELVSVVEGLGANGEGIVRPDNVAVFVPFSLPGETIKYKIVKVQKNYAFGKLLEVLTPSKNRVEAPCEVFGKCGGCQLQHLEYNAQLDEKVAFVKDCFNKFANIQLDNVVKNHNQKPYGYRNKLQIPIQNTANGVKIGFYAVNSHRIVPITECKINENWAVDVISCFQEFIDKYKLSAYDEVTKKGLLRHIVVRNVCGRLIITLVVNTDKFTLERQLIELISSRFSNATLYLNVNEKDTNVICGEKFKLLYGEPTADYEFMGVKAKISVQSFMQVNKSVSEKIYERVLDIVKDSDANVVVDAYSGAGLLGGIMAKSGKFVYGIEIVKEAVACANQLAKDNGLDNVKNLCGNCEELLPGLFEKLGKEKVMVVLDPPRKGCDKNVTSALKKLKPEKIVYVSCNPATLARDIGQFMGTIDGENNDEYEITNVELYDMFSQTKHVETLVCLSRKAD